MKCRITTKTVCKCQLLFKMKQEKAVRTKTDKQANMTRQRSRRHRKLVVLEWIHRENWEWVIADSCWWHHNALCWCPVTPLPATTSFMHLMEFWYVQLYPTWLQANQRRHFFSNWPEWFDSWNPTKVKSDFTCGKGVQFKLPETPLPPVCQAE